MDPRRSLLACLLVVSVVATGVAGASALGRPVLHASLADDTVSAGEETTLSLTVANEGDLRVASPTNPTQNQRVTTARAVTVAVDAGSAPVSVETDEHLLGSLPEGGAATLPFRVHVAPDAAPGTYELPVTLAYTYTSSIADAGPVQDETRRVHTTVSLTVRPDARFAVRDAATDVRAGAPGSVNVTVQNVGSEAARNASVTLASEDGSLGVDSGASARYVDDWPAGENRTLTYRVTSAPANTRRTASLALDVAYRSPDGRQRHRGPVRFGATVDPAPTFDYRDVTGTLRVAAPGTVAATVVNTGPTTVRNASVVLDPTTPDVRVRATERYVGTLAPGERQRVTFDADVAPSARAATSAFALRTRYDARDGGRRESDAATRGVTVAPRRDALDVRVRNGTTAPDTDAYHYTLTVTNVGDVPREDVVLSLAAAPPVGAVTRTAYVDHLAPGERANVTFVVSTDADAATGDYPVRITATSDTPERENVTTGPLVRSLRIEETPTGVTNYAVLGVVALVAALLVGALWWWLRG